MNFIEGEIFYLDKPYKWTSFDAVKYVRGALIRRTGIRKFKVGHAGTLDPLATGVMILCTGRATKRIEELQAGVKEYVADIALGATTPSFDLETAVDAVFPVGHITRQAVEAVLERFKGRIEQIPPKYSACKVDGRRAYLYARKGQEPELKPKVLVIDYIELLEYNDGPCVSYSDAPAVSGIDSHSSLPAPAYKSIKLRIVCSKGTYIRALARDIGLALGSGAHLTALRRTRVGDVAVSDCLSPQQLAGTIAVAPMEISPDDWRVYGDMLRTAVPSDRWPGNTSGKVD